MRSSASMSGGRRPHRRLAVGLVACVAALSVGPAFAQGDFDIFFQCNDGGTNLNSGDFGDVGQPNWGGVISYLEGAQRDMGQDGSSAGPFQHAGVTIVKYVSKSSPEYMDALYQNTTLDDCTIKFYALNLATAPFYEHRYTVELTNVKVALISNQGSNTRILEEITFHAASIRRTHEPSGKTSQQNLGAPN